MVLVTTITIIGIMVMVTEMTVAQGMSRSDNGRSSCESGGQSVVRSEALSQALGQGHVIILPEHGCVREDRRTDIETRFRCARSSFRLSACFQWR
jgi:hypothetical protein